LIIRKLTIKELNLSFLKNNEEYPINRPLSSTKLKKPKLASLLGLENSFQESKKENIDKRIPVTNNQKIFTEDSFDECEAQPEENQAPNEEDSSNILNTIKIISSNPEKFKHTNNMLKSLGGLAKNNMHILFSEKEEKEKADKAYKEFEKAAEDRKKLSQNIKSIDNMMKSNNKELNNFRGK
jgi:hypothetical protein